MVIFGFDHSIRKEIAFIRNLDLGLSIWPYDEGLGPAHQIGPDSQKPCQIKYLTPSIIGQNMIGCGFGRLLMLDPLHLD